LATWILIGGFISVTAALRGYYSGTERWLFVSTGLILFGMGIVRLVRM